MMKADSRRAATLAVTLLAGAACSESGSNLPNDGGSGGSPSSPGGTGGGQSSLSGAAGASEPGGSGAGGSSGDGGSGAGGLSSAGGSWAADGGLPHFTATREGDTVRLTTSDEVWIESCFRNPRVVQHEGDGWAALRDDRPDGYNLLRAGHYLDGAFVDETCGLSLGCDVVGCTYFPSDPEDFIPFYQRFSVREYVQVGEAAAPTCDFIDAGVPLDGGADAGVRQVPNIESRAPTGALGVEIRYYLDSSCESDVITTVVAVE